MHGRSVPPWERMTIRLYCTYYRIAKRRYYREQGASGRVYEDLQDVPETLRDVAYYKHKNLRMLFSLLSFNYGI